MAERIQYRIVVVDQWSPRPLPSARAMIDAGLPVGVIARWIKVKREFSPKGLARKVKGRVN